MSNYIIDTKEVFQLTTRTLRAMAKQGIGHSTLFKVADNVSGRKSTTKSKPTKKQKPKRRTKKQKIADAKKGKYVNPLTNRKCSYKYALQKGFITELGEKIPLKDMKFENPETGRMVSYSYAKQKGII